MSDNPGRQSHKNYGKELERLEEKSKVTQGSKPNVTLVFTGGDGEQAAYRILAEIAIKKLKGEEEKCEQQSMPE